MARVKKLNRITLEKSSPHKDVECTYALVQTVNDGVQLQVDTYGSSDRQIPNKKSQSLRFTRASMEQLRDILNQILK